jgi:hypothetical protein
LRVEFFDLTLRHQADWGQVAPKNYGRFLRP